MNKVEIKALRTAARTITSDARRLKKAVNVLQALDGFTGDANGTLQEVARLEAVAAIRGLKRNIDQIAAVINIDADVIVTTPASKIANHTDEP